VSGEEREEEEENTITEMPSALRRVCGGGSAIYAVSDSDTPCICILRSVSLTDALEKPPREAPRERTGWHRRRPFKSSRWPQRGPKEGPEGGPHSAAFGGAPWREGPPGVGRVMETAMH